MGPDDQMADVGPMSQVDTLTHTEDAHGKINRTHILLACVSAFFLLCCKNSLDGFMCRKTINQGDSAVVVGTAGSN